MSTPKSPRHQAALDFAADGIPVFPCQVDGKMPVTANGFYDASTDPTVIDGWWSQADYNLAIEPERAGLCVVDLDTGVDKTGRIKDGAATWRTLQVEHDDAPATYTVRTPRGGTHLYFQGSLPGSAGKLGLDVDTRGRGSYVLVAPSVVDGRPYEVIADVDPAPVPAWVTAAINVAPEHHAAPVENVNPIEVERRARDLLTRYVRDGKVAIEGRGGDNLTYQVACELHNLGCTEEQALALLMDIWNPHCVPPWDEAELSAKIQNASQYAQNDAAAWASAPTAETFRDFLDSPVSTQQSAPPPGLPDPEPLATLLAGVEKPVAMLIEQLVQKTKFNVLRGRGGSNKSRLALEWAILLDLGLSAAGFVIPERVTALYISCEDETEEMQRRSKAIVRKLALPTNSQVLYFDMADADNTFLQIASDEFGVTVTDKGRDLERRLMAIPGHKFLVLDSTYDVVDFVGSTKNSDNHVRQVIRNFDRLCRRTDTTILCLWHPSRAGMSRGDEGGFATAWDNTPRNVISIKPMEEEDAFELTAEKRNNIAKFTPIVLQWKDGALIRASADTATGMMEHEVIVTLALEAAKSGQPIQLRGKPDVWVFEEIFRQTGRRVSVKEIRSALNRETRRETSRLEYRHYNPHGRGEPAGWVSKF